MKHQRRTVSIRCAWSGSGVCSHCSISQFSILWATSTVNGRHWSRIASNKANSEIVQKWIREKAKKFRLRLTGDWPTPERLIRSRQLSSRSNGIYDWWNNWLICQFGGRSYALPAKQPNSQTANTQKRTDIHDSLRLPRYKLSCFIILHWDTV